MFKWLTLLALIVALVFAMATCSVAPKLRASQFEHKYRLTLEMVVNGEPRIGSGVVDVVWYKAPLGYPWFSKIHGQGVLVDINPYGAMIAALRPSSGSKDARSMDAIAISALQNLSRGAGSYDLTPETLEQIGKIKKLTDLSQDNMPQLIWIPNPDVPNSVRSVRSDEISSVIGKNVRFKKAWIEITDEPVTTGLKQKLQALSKQTENGQAVSRELDVFTLDTRAIFGDDD